MRRRALIGPQRDELLLTLRGEDIGDFGSSGEQRRVALLLVLASLGIVVDRESQVPVLLIDDVDSELDEYRLDRVVTFLGRTSQTFVTTPKTTVAERYASLGRILRVDRGMIRPYINR